ncbi:MAG TPA: hypothetical protein EYO90_00160 [Candidatus Latescibacteria bacterium]|nr:hypothetical protein [Candidatus Latescibacterota bacterium]
MRETPGMLVKESETFRIMGSRGRSRKSLFEIERPDLANVDLGNLIQPSRQDLTPAQMRDPLPPDVTDAFKRAMHQEVEEEDLQHMDFSPPAGTEVRIPIWCTSLSRRYAKAASR